MSKKNSNLIYDDGNASFEVEESDFKQELIDLLPGIFHKQYPLIKMKKINKKSKLIFNVGKKDNGEIL